MLRGCGQLRGAKVTCSGEGQLGVWPPTLGEEIRDVMVERDSGEGMVGERW